MVATAQLEINRIPIKYFLPNHSCRKRLIDQVVLPFLVSGNVAKQPLEHMEVHVHQWHAGEEKDMAAVRHALEACLEGAPSRLAHDPFTRPFGTQIRGHDADLAQAVGPTELFPATVGKPLRQVVGCAASWNRAKCSRAADQSPWNIALPNQSAA